MTFYQVDGTSVLSWSLLVEARNESEAAESAVRIAGYLSDLRQDHALRDAHHQIVGSRKLIRNPAEVVAGDPHEARG
jgi:hypothetical protein